MADNTTGHVGSLTPPETLKLQEIWIHLLRLCGHIITPSTFDPLPPDLAASHHQQHLQPQSTLHHSDVIGDSRRVPPITPAIFRTLLWNFFQADHPDVMVLRFLRARKWDVEKSLSMLLSTLNWRHEQDVESIVKHGELLPAHDHHHTPRTGEFEIDKNMAGQYETGKAFIRGADKSGRPVFVVRVRHHHPDAQSPGCMERWVLHNIETMRSILRSKHSNGAGEKVCLIFDLTGFGMKNMDFHVVKFLILAFEARYPEYLGRVLVHNAPWVFWGIWRVIKPWLDPVIAAKIQFTTLSSSSKDKSGGRLTEHVHPDNLERCLGGTDDWVYKYHPPIVGENEKMKEISSNKEVRERFRTEREGLMDEFERNTLEWAVRGLKIQGVDDDMREKDKERLQLARILQRNFWALDPYVRARNPCHRSGILKQDGEVAVDYKGII